MERKYIYGFDWLRAIMSIFVVAWHMHLFGTSMIFEPAEFDYHQFMLNDFINFHLLLLAVPTFIYMSLILFVNRSQTFSTLLNRVKDIVIILVFWIFALSIWNGGSSGLINLIPQSTIMGIVRLVFTGGGTIYYFFVSLIVSTVITFWVAKLNFRNQLIGLILSAFVVVLLPYMTILMNIPELSSYWSPLNFIPYCFAAVLLINNQEKIKSNKLFFLVLILLSLIFSIFEWLFYTNKVFFLGQGYAIPAYTRISILFSSSILILLFFNVKEKSSAIITFMSDNSMGLFLLHPFFIVYSRRIAAKLIPENEILKSISAFLITILISYCISVILKKYVLKKTVIR